VTRPRIPSPQTLSVLGALARDPAEWRYGYDLGVELGLKSGSLYPILIRLDDRGLLESSWDAGPPGKPARHLYRLTAAGLEEAGRLASEPGAQAEPPRVRPRRPASRIRLQGS
jgi:PadR family transcriptional regulator, regulatory protein PadR